MHTLLLALLLDSTFPEPPNSLHPVAWMGTAIGRLQRAAPQHPTTPLPPFVYGGFIAAGGALTAYSLGLLAERAIGRLPHPMNLLVEATLLKTTFALNGLRRAAAEVQTALEAADLPEARRRLAWHLVSRDTAALTPAQVAAATIESIAENTSDSVIAPLFYYTIGRLPAAFAYRYLNTADAMLGYRDDKREWLGKLPAWLDDIANFIPARLTATLILAGSWLMQQPSPSPFIYPRDHSQTASPNAGHPMSAMAATLGLELEKVDHYTLGKGQRHPTSADIPRAVRLMFTATLLALPFLHLLARRAAPHT